MHVLRLGTSGVGCPLLQSSVGHSSGTIACDLSKTVCIALSVQVKGAASLQSNPARPLETQAIKKSMLGLPAQVLNYIAGGRDIASGVSYVCQGIIRGPAVPLVKRLAYDVVHAAALTDADWDNVIEGLKSDLAGTFSLEVRWHDVWLHTSYHLEGVMASTLAISRVPFCCWPQSSNEGQCALSSDELLEILCSRC